MLPTGTGSVGVNAGERETPVSNLAFIADGGNFMSPFDTRVAQPDLSDYANLPVDSESQQVNMTMERDAFMSADTEGGTLTTMTDKAATAVRSTLSVAKKTITAAADIVKAEIPEDRKDDFKRHVDGLLSYIGIDNTCQHTFHFLIIMRGFTT